MASPAIPDGVDPIIADLCEEFRIELLDQTTYPGPRQTRAGRTLTNVLRERGYQHVRMLIMTLGETANNAGHIDKHLIWATSRLIDACASVIEADPSGWLECWDQIPLGQLQWISRDMSGHSRLADVIAGMVYEHIFRRFGPMAQQPDLFDDRRPDDDPRPDLSPDH